MARLNRALSDRARIVRLIAAAERVEGASPMVEVGGDWIAARLVPGAAVEREDPDGRRVVRARAQLVCGADALDVLPSDRVEVRSRLLGDSTWNVVGLPERATTSRAVVGVVIPLEREVEATRESVLA